MRAALATFHLALPEVGLDGVNIPGHVPQVEGDDERLIEAVERLR